MSDPIHNKIAVPISRGWCQRARASPPRVHRYQAMAASVLWPLQKVHRQDRGASSTRSKGTGSSMPVMAASRRSVSFWP